MNARQAKALAKAWVQTNLPRWPGLRAAHLVGGITSLPGDAPFPPHKDVDLHLVFADDSPDLRHELPSASLFEEAYRGIAIEAGAKPLADYRPAAVLGNPEIAHHLLLDGILWDPSGLLDDLAITVRREYRRRRWVRARLDHERRGLANAVALRPMARAAFGPGGEVNILGWTTTFATGALQVAALEPPRMGSRSLRRLGEALAGHARSDLYEEVLGALGLADAGRAAAERGVREATAAFDRAVAVRRTAAGPFQHKFRRHLRPYLIESCRELLAEGHFREALGWAMPYRLAAADILLIDGPAADAPRVAAERDAFLASLGLAHAEAVDAAFARATRAYDEVFALAEALVADHPAMVG